MHTIMAYLKLQEWTAPESIRAASGWMLRLLALLPIPVLVKVVFDDAIPNGDSELLMWVGAGMVLLQGVSYTGLLLARPVAIRKAWETGARLRDRMLTDLYRRSLASVRSRPSADLHDLIVHEVERIDSFGVAINSLIIPPLFFAAGLIILLLVINWWMCLALAVFAPIFYSIGRAISKRVRERTITRNEIHRTVSVQTMRAADSVELTHTRSAEGFEVGEAAERHALLAAAGARMQFAQQMHSDSLQAILAVTVAVTLVIGGVAVINETITIGDLFAFYAGLALLRQPLARLSTGLPSVAAGVSSFNRVTDYLSDVAEPPYEGSKPHTIQHTIALDNVTFAYAEEPVVAGVSLTLKRGTVTLLVGPNGSGKSTLFNLLLGLYRPDAGTVTADGTPYDELDLVDIRNQIGAVFQTPYMIEGTIGENLRYGRPTATDADLDRAAHIASARSVIDALPAGMDTKVGGAGTTISGGQRQRIAIARALVGQPTVLLLDEPTNHLDRASLDIVLRNIVGMEGAPAVLLVSHDDRVVDLAHTVVELEDGHVVGVRNPTEAP